MSDATDDAPGDDAAPPRRTSWRESLRGGWLDAGDREKIFNESATAATDARVPYWLLLVLAGAIAALGLALDSAAVVIGAMLIAPLLSPVTGLALSLAIGDGRLAVETLIIVLTSTAAVIAAGALLALALPVPFQSVTSEILARTRPTTLDLVIAAFSGIAGAVVAVSGRRHLSGAVPGVAVSVALVPPLAVTGYGIGTGWNGPIIRGSLLLYGANLAGIVMSAMVIFIIAGMHRPEVLTVDERWHRQARSTPLTAWVERIPGLRAIGIMQSTWTRIALVAAFVAIVAVPLSASLGQIARESRVHAAVTDAMEIFSKPGQSFVISRDIEMDGEQTRVILNVATTGWFGDSARRAFERRATTGAGEPVKLVLEQLPASSGDVSQLATLVSAPRQTTSVIATSVPAATMESRISALRAAVNGAVESLALPESLTIAGSQLALGDSSAPPVLRLGYLGPDSLSAQAAQIVRQQLASELMLPGLRLATEHISDAPRRLDRVGSATVDSLAALLGRYPRLRIQLTAGPAVPQARVDSIVARLTGPGAPGAVTAGDGGAASEIVARVVAPH